MWADAMEKIKHCRRKESFIVSPRMMSKVARWLCWIVVIAAAGFMRFDDLAARPFHADEATGARITARRMEQGGSNFDPKHYHGPLLANLAMPLCRLRGETTWRGMTKETPRLLAAIAGTLLVLLPLAGLRRFGHAPMLAAAAILATSPLLVYYSRMFIHEPLLVLAGVAVLFSLAGGARWGGAGFLTGLMFAVKETFAISVIAWSAAGVILLLENRRFIRADSVREAWRRWRRPIVLSLAAFFATWIFIYTDAMRQPRGAFDAVRTFFIYETGAGHGKPFSYYFRLLAWPEKSAGLWWFGTPVVLLALAAYAGSFRRAAMMENTRLCVRFLAYSAAGHFLIYSMISYKTPWLACLPWAHVCLLAGFAPAIVPWRGIAAKAAIALVLAATLASQFTQSRMAAGRLASDSRNPFAYVPTLRDVERLEEWLGRLEKSLPPGALEPSIVIGRNYWPLPWYLRSREKTGWHATPPPDLNAMPLVFALPEAEAEVTEQLNGTHAKVLRSLRADVPLMMFLRNDLWDAWMNPPD
jgi:uncharacterized protein (TIGR03663 family)